MALGDPNLFYDSQLENDKTSWELTVCTNNSGGHDKNFSLRGIITEDTITVGAQHDYTKGLPDAGVGAIINNAVGDFKKDMDENYMAGQSMGGLMDGSSIAATAGGAGNGYKQGLGNFLVMALSAVSGNVIQAAIEGAIGAAKVAAGAYGATHKLISGTDYVRTFDGTNTSIEIPELTTRIYHMQYGSPVKDVITNLIKYTTGEWAHPTNMMGTDSDSMSGASEKTGDLFGFLKAPNGYISTMYNLNGYNSQKGTFDLRYGGYKYKGLLLDDFSIKASTLGVVGTKENRTNEILYADISLRLSPLGYCGRATMLGTLNKT